MDSRPCCGDMPASVESLARLRHSACTRAGTRALGTRRDLANGAQATGGGGQEARRSGLEHMSGASMRALLRSTGGDAAGEACGTRGGAGVEPSVFQRAGHERGGRSGTWHPLVGLVLCADSRPELHREMRRVRSWVQRGETDSWESLVLNLLPIGGWGTLWLPTEALAYDLSDIAARAGVSERYSRAVFTRPIVAQTHARTCGAPPQTIGSSRRVSLANIIPVRGGRGVGQEAAPSFGQEEAMDWCASQLSSCERDAGSPLIF